MEFISYIAVLLLSYFGLAAGVALAFIAKEEIEPGKKYLTAIQNILMIAIILIVIYFLEIPWLIWIILIGCGFLAAFIKKQRKKSFLIYLLFSVILWISSQPKAFFSIKFLFPLTASLIFLIGFPTGSLLIDLKKRKIYPIMVSNIHFIIIGLILYFI